MAWPYWKDWYNPKWSFSGGLLVKNLPVNAGDARDAGLIPGSGRFPEVGNGNPLQYTCLENSMDRDIVHRVRKSWTWLNTNTHNPQYIKTIYSLERNRGGACWNMKSKLDLVINHIQQRKTEVEMTLRFWGNHNGNKNHSLYLNLRKNSFLTHQVLLC